LLNPEFGFPVLNPLIQ